MSYNYHDPTPMFFNVLVTTSFYMAMCFFALCLACGFYYIAELSEEYTVLTRKILKYMIYVIWVVYSLLWIVDGFPLYCVLTGALCHAAYFTLLPRFPFVTLTSPSLMASVVAFMASHVVWYHYFIDSYSPAYEYGHLLGFFFLCVWMVQFAPSTLSIVYIPSLHQPKLLASNSSSTLFLQMSVQFLPA